MRWFILDLKKFRNILTIEKMRRLRNVFMKLEIKEVVDHAGLLLSQKWHQIELVFTQMESMIMSSLLSILLIATYKSLVVMEHRLKESFTGLPNMESSKILANLTLLLTATLVLILAKTASLTKFINLSPLKLGLEML
jgi:hypothetical protein